jgi:hypothetical protein
MALMGATLSETQKGKATNMVLTIFPFCFTPKVESAMFL